MCDNINKPILVIGASGAIGGAVASMLLAAGHTVGLHYHSNRKAVELLAVDNENAVILQSQLCSIADCDTLVTEFKAAVGAIYGIALCGGHVPWKSWRETTEKDWCSAYFEHCIVPFSLARAAAGYMASGGRVVFLSSISAKYGGSSRTLHYGAAKAGLEAGMKGLARELASRDIYVNAVRSGFVITPQQHAGRSPEQLTARINCIPVRRAGIPEEIASAFDYLFSSGASFVTGEIITIAGGD